MLRWLRSFCARLVRRAEMEDGHAAADLDAGLSVIIPVVSGEAVVLQRSTEPVDLEEPRTNFLLAARIASSRSLNAPAGRPKKSKPRFSSTKPLPKLTAKRPKSASGRRQAMVLTGRPDAAPAMTADVVPFVPRPAKPASRGVKLAKAA